MKTTKKEIRAARAAQLAQVAKIEAAWHAIKYGQWTPERQATLDEENAKLEALGA